MSYHAHAGRQPKSYQESMERQGDQSIYRDNRFVPRKGPSNVEMAAYSREKRKTDRLDRALTNFIVHFEEFLEGLSCQPL